jgi:hypothetical protein
MNDIKKDKIDRHSDELEVESDEKLTGKKIELDEDSSRAMAIHIRQDGRKRWSATQWPCCGQPSQPDCRWAPRYWLKGFFTYSWKVCQGILLENLGYTFGFIIVIMARQQLFTENTVTAVLPVMQNPTLGNFGLLMRLWSVVLLGNIIGTGVAAWAFEHMPIFDEETRDAFVKIGMDVMKTLLWRCFPTPSFLAG